VGYSIPVIYLACDRSDLPATLNRWTDAERVITAADADRTKYKMRMATARNWWQLLAITEIRDRERLPGLDFCDAEITLLQGSDLDIAISSLSRVVEAQIENGNCERVPTILDDSNSDIDCESPNGLASFLQSLISVIHFAKNRGKSFLFLQPNP
jgi:hypothetical protein